MESQYVTYRDDRHPFVYWAWMRMASPPSGFVPPSPDEPLAVLKWVYQRSKEGCFSRKRSERDRALSDINRYTEKFQ